MYAVTYLRKKGYIYGIKTGLEGYIVTMHEVMCETGNPIPKPLDRVIGRTVRTTLSAL